MLDGGLGGAIIGGADPGRPFPAVEVVSVAPAKKNPANKGERSPKRVTIVGVEEIPATTRQTEKGKVWKEIIAEVQAMEKGQTLELQTATDNDARALRDALVTAGFESAVTRKGESGVRFVYVET
jgi:uncharacterized caspase-like protein